MCLLFDFTKGDVEKNMKDHAITALKKETDALENTLDAIALKEGLESKEYSEALTATESQGTPCMCTINGRRTPMFRSCAALAVSG